jgi:light-regulated signal transduction histidine kinase (bacteriophytochrome)
MSTKTQGEDIAVLKADLKNVRELVERNHHDAEVGKTELKASLVDVQKSISELKTDLNERKGAEKLANAIRMTFAGTIGAMMVKAISWLGAIPR